LRVLHVRFGDVFVVQHLRQNAVSRLDGTLRMPVRRGVIVWRANNARQERALRKRELAQVFSKIRNAGLGKSSNAKAAPVAQTDFVRVHLENLFLVEALLQFEGKHRFGQFSTPVAVGGKEECPRDLHRDGAGTLQPRTVAQVVPRRTEDPDEVKAGMLEESL